MHAHDLFAVSCNVIAHALRNIKGASAERAGTEAEQIRSKGCPGSDFFQGESNHKTDAIF